MRNNRFYLPTVLMLALFLGACGGGDNSQNNVATKPARFVNPFAGTGAMKSQYSGVGGVAGHTFPGAVLPFGMIQWSPDTLPDKTNLPGGYDYADSKIRGFSLHHFSGAGCAIYQDLPFLPTTAPINQSPVKPKPSGVAAWRSLYIPSFNHKEEKAEPGFYQVLLNPDSAQPIQTELTVTTRAGIARFTFPQTRHASILINAGGSVHAGIGFGNSAAGVTILPEKNEVAGHARGGRFCVQDNAYTLYFVARFNRPFAAFGTWNNQHLAPGSTAASDDTSQAKAGAYVTFDTTQNRQVLIRVGVSFVSVANARKNLEAEIGNAGFAAIHTKARKTWNDALGRISVAGGAGKDVRTFYTALYHSMIDPSTFNDVNGEYPGMDGRLQRTAPGHSQYTDIGGWDVYRSEFPLIAMLFPHRASDMIRSLLAYQQQTGYLPKFAVANGQTDIMVGDPADAMIAGAYALGAADFNHDHALQAMVKGATDPTQLHNKHYVERQGLRKYLNTGYIPLELNYGGGNSKTGFKSGGYATALDPANVWGSAATTLEYAVDDFAISQFALAMGKEKTCQTFLKRSTNWENLFNPATGYLQPRYASGKFHAFDPTSAEGWVEGSTAQYTWFVPHDRAGLFAKMGGSQAVSKRLNAFFTRLNAGPVSRYAFLGNEFDLGAPWSYDWLGRPYKTQALVRRAILSLYSAKPAGNEPGNDDTGALSS